jgi:hypothetical protein
MIITNKYGLPDTLMNVVKRDPYTKGKARLSVTQLINSPKVVALQKLHDDEIETDLADLFWSVFGKAVHNIIEVGKSEGDIVEQRLHANIDGWDISGALDLQQANPFGISLTDWKTTSVWAVMNEKIEWEYQLNIYAWLVETIKRIPVSDINITAILRDWKEREKQTKEGYPEAPIINIRQTLWTMAEREEFIKARISLHSACEFAMETGGALPDCTPEEMWEKPTVYAVMKEGNKRATKVCETKEGAEKEVVFMKEKKPKDKFLIVERLGERTRCKTYCTVSTWCNQYKAYMEEQDEGETEN